MGEDTTDVATTPTPQRLTEAEFATLQQSLPSLLRQELKNTPESLRQHFALLALMSPERELLQKCHQQIFPPTTGSTNPTKFNQSQGGYEAIIDQLQDNFINSPRHYSPMVPSLGGDDARAVTDQQSVTLFRLPEISGEYAVRNQQINRAIKRFNNIITAYYQAQAQAQGKNSELPLPRLASAYQSILKQVKMHGSSCNNWTMRNLFIALAGWSSNRDHLLADPNLALDKPQSITTKPAEQAQESPTTIPILTPVTPPKNVAANRPNSQKSLEHSMAFNISRGGMLRKVTAVSAHMFETKPGGHTDGLAKDALVPTSMAEFVELSLRPLSHRLPDQLVADTDAEEDQADTAAAVLSDDSDNEDDEYTDDDEYETSEAAEATIPTLSPSNISDIRILLTQTLTNLGLRQTKTGMMIPFTTLVVAGLDKDYVHQLLLTTQQENYINKIAPDPELESIIQNILSDHIFELISGSQSNVGVALGIGANWDGTISTSNEGGTYFFRFLEHAQEWAKRYETLSRLRQGPAEATMNAGKGMGFELKSLLLGQEYMARLQPSEYASFLYSALVDNLLADIYPDPAYFENASYQKYRLAHRATTNDAGERIVATYAQEDEQGTFFKDKKTGKLKQVPMHRRQGTLEHVPFSRDSESSAGSRDSMKGNPDAVLHAQHAASAQASRRGNLVYNPLGEDIFIDDPFQGQYIRYQDGTTLLFNGVMPKNFDRQFNLDTELCASFVVRMMHSSNIHQCCPAFRAVTEAIKRQLMPNSDNTKFLADFKKEVYALAQYQGPGSSYFAFIAILENLSSMTELNCATCHRLLRELKANAPSNPEHNLAYQAAMIRIESLIKNFYPTPSDELSNCLNKLVKAQVPLLLKDPHVLAYFRDLKEKQAGIAKTITPETFFTELRYGGASTDITGDYQRLHGKNAESGMRDVQGHALIEREESSKMLDAAAKTAGAMVQTAQVYKLLAIVTRTLSHPFVQAYDAYNEFPEDSKPRRILHALGGFFYGLLAGLATGIWYLMTAPFRLGRRIYQKWKEPALDAEHQTMVDSPLHISAAPENTPGSKARHVKAAREIVLGMDLNRLANLTRGRYRHAAGVPSPLTPLPEGEGPGRGEERANIYTDAIFRLTTKAITQYLQERNITAKGQRQKTIEDYQKRFRADTTIPKQAQQILDGKRILTQAAKQAGGTPLVKLLTPHTSHMTEQLLAAAYQLLLENLQQPTAKTLEALKSKWHLKAHELELITKIHEIYLQAPMRRNALLALFANGGVFYNEIQRRHRFARTIEHHLAACLDETLPVELSAPELTQKKYEEFVTDSLVGRLFSDTDVHKHLAAVNLAIKNELKENYSVTESLGAMFAKTPGFAVKQQQLADLLIAMPQLYAALANEFPTIANTDSETLSHNLENPPSLPAAALPPLQRGGGDTPTSTLSTLAKQHQLIITQLDPNQHPKSHQLLQNLFDVTCQRLVQQQLNTTLANHSLFDAQRATPLANPLLASPELKAWLSTLYDQPDAFQQFLQHQHRSAPSLEEALFRYKCIFQAIEAHRQPTDPQQPARALDTAAIEPLLTLWQQAGNVNRLGVQHQTELQQKLQVAKAKQQEAFVKGSATVTAAYQKVQSDTSKDSETAPSSLAARLRARLTPKQ